MDDNMNPNSGVDNTKDTTQNDDLTTTSPADNAEGEKSEESKEEVSQPVEEASTTEEAPVVEKASDDAAETSV